MIEELRNPNCELCELCTTSKAKDKHLVCLMGKGKESSPIVFVGEALGYSEIIQETPFVGDAGHVLNLAIQEAGYDRDEVFATNAVKCLRGKTRILLEDGSYETISKLVTSEYSGKVASISASGELVYSNVTAWHRSPLAGRKVLKLTFPFSKNNPKGVASAELTEDHEVLTTNGWRKSGELDGSDLVDAGLRITELERDLIVGSLLGDACIPKRAHNFQVSHSYKYKEYSDLKFQLLHRFNPRTRDLIAKASNKKSYKVRRVYTLFSPVFDYYRYKFYTDKKLVPEDLELTPRALAFWFMDDGYTKIKSENVGLSEIATCAFSDTDLDLLITKIKALGITQCYKRAGRLYFGSQGSKELSKLISPYVIPTFRYKLHPHFSNINLYDAEALFDSGSMVSVYGQPIVTEVKMPVHEKTVYCIDVEDTHNFISRAGVLHNCRPPENRTPKSKEIKSCRPYLEAELKELKPKIICVLGATALESVLKIKGITKYRGQIIWSEEFNCNVIPAFHPAFVLRNNDCEEVFHRDIKKALDTAFSKETKVQQNSKNYFVVTTIKEFRKVRKFLLTKDELAVDTETFKGDPIEGEILCIPISWEVGCSVTIPLCGKGMVPIWEPSEQIEIKEGLEEILYTKKLIFQNGKYDMQFFIMAGFDKDKLFNSWVRDTMLMHHLLDENSKHGLDELSLKYTDLGAYYQDLDEMKEVILKDLNKGKKNKILKENFTYDLFPTELLYRYANDDANATKILDGIFSEELKKYPRLELLLTELTMPLAKILTEMEMTGINIDQERLDRNIEVLSKRLTEVEESLHKNEHVMKCEKFFIKQARKELKEHYEGLKTKRLPWEEYEQKYIIPEDYKFNFSSSKQLKTLFYDELQLDEIVNPKTQRPTLDRKALEVYAEEHPFCNELLEYRNLQQFLSTFLVGVKERLGADGRLRTSFLQHGTVTGRLSCLREGTRIMTNRGFIPIEAIKVGDCVITQFGYKRVLNTFSKKSKIVEIVCDGKSTFCSPEHPFLTNSGNFIEAGKLKKGNILCGSHTAFPSMAPAVDKEAELLGYALGDGHVREGYKNKPDVVMLALALKDLDLYDYFKVIVANLYKKELKLLRTKTCYDMRIYSVDVAKHFVEKGLAVYSHKAEIPKWLYDSEPYVIASFLRGLFEADGCITNHADSVSVGGGRGAIRTSVLTYSSVSRKLIYQICELLSIFGIRTSTRYYKYGQVLSKRGLWVLNIKGSVSKSNFLKYIGFLSKRKKKYYEKSIVNISNKKDNFDRFIIPENFKFTSSVGSIIKQKGLSRKVVQEFVDNRIVVLSQLLENFVDGNQYHVPIDKIKRFNKIENVYDIEVEDCHEYLVNTLICHNSRNPNFQNIPKQKKGDVDPMLVRECYIPTEGWKLVEADFAQLEWRIFADASKDPLMHKAIVEGLDIHRKVASVVYQCTEEEVTKDQRARTKNTVFGLLYGESVWALSKRLKMSEEEAQSISDIFFSMFPDAFKVIEYYRGLARKNGYVENYFGRRRRFPILQASYHEAKKKEWNEALRQAFNFRIQGTAGDITSFAMIRLHKKIKKLGIQANMLIQIHDAIVFDVKNEDLDKLCRLIKKEMPRPVAGMIVPLEVEIECGDRWSELKHWEDPEENRDEVA